MTNFLTYDEVPRVKYSIFKKALGMFCGVFLLLGIISLVSGGSPLVAILMTNIATAFLVILLSDDTANSVGYWGRTNNLALKEILEKIEEERVRYK